METKELEIETQKKLKKKASRQMRLSIFIFIVGLVLLDINSFTNFISYPVIITSIGLFVIGILDYTKFSRNISSIKLNGTLEEEHKIRTNEDSFYLTVTALIVLPAVFYVYGFLAEANPLLFGPAGIILIPLIFLGVMMLISKAIKK